MCSATLSLTSALDGVGGPRSAAFTPERDSVPVLWEADWVPGPVWAGVENPVPTGIRSPDRPARSQTLHRLHYPGPRRGTDIM